MNYDHNKKIGLLKFNSDYGTFNLNSPKGYSLKTNNVQTDWHKSLPNAFQKAIALEKKDSKFYFLLKGLLNGWTLVELCHESQTFTEVDMDRPFSTDVSS